MKITVSRQLAAAMSMAFLHSAAIASECAPDQFIAHVLQRCASESHAPAPATAAHDVADGLTAPERFIATVLARKPSSASSLEALVDPVQSPADTAVRADDYFIAHVLLAPVPPR